MALVDKLVDETPMRYKQQARFAVKTAIAAMEAENDSLRKDAERYLECLRWVQGYITRYDPPGLPKHLAFGIKAAMRKETP